MQNHKEKTDLVIYLVAIFVVALNLFLILSFAFSTEVSKLPSPLSPLRKRGPLQIPPVDVIRKPSMVKLREVSLRMNYHETFVLVPRVTWGMYFT